MILALDAFALIMLGGLAVLVVVLLLLGRFYPGSGAEQLDWRPARSYEQQVIAEVEDLDQMLEAANARRRRRGEPELTEDAIHARVREDMTDAEKRREAYLAEREVEQLLAVKNERRRRKGLPEIGLEEFKASLARGRER